MRISTAFLLASQLAEYKLTFPIFSPLPFKTLWIFFTRLKKQECVWKNLAGVMMASCAVVRIADLHIHVM